MSAFLTLADLKAGIKTWLSDSNVNDAVLNQAVALCEADINQRTRLLQGEATADVTIDSADVTAPSGFRGAIRFYITGSPNQALEYQTPEQMIDRTQGDITGKPRWFSVVGSVSTALPRLLFAPSPDTTYAAKLLFHKSWELSSDSATNYMLINYPGAYLYGALVHMRAKLQEPERLPEFQGLFDRYVTQALEDDMVNRAGSMPRAVRPFVAMGSGWL